MARILVATWPFLGHLLPHIEIARGLQQRGHDIAIYCHSTTLPLLRNTGFQFFPFFRLDQSPCKGGLIRDKQKLSWARPWRAMKMCTSWVLDSVPEQVADLEDIIRIWKPDVLVSDEIMWGCTLIVAEKHHLPLAVCSTFGGCMLPGPDAPLFGWGLGPLRGPGSHAIHRGIDFAVSAIASSSRRQANNYRLEHGLRPLKGPLRAHAGNASVYLARGCPQFDYERRDLPNSVRYIGPLAWSGDTEEREPAWLKGVVQSRRPIVYVSEGTVQTGPPTLLQAAVRGLRGEDFQVIITTGSRPTSELEQSRLPPNMLVKDWIPERLVLPFASVVVSAGGAGTVFGALEAGVPVLVVPQQSDQPDNAQRVIRSGVGLSLPRSRCTPENLRNAVKRLLEERSFQVNARNMQRAFSAYSSREISADLIEELVPVGVS